MEFALQRIAFKSERQSAVACCLQSGFTLRGVQVPPRSALDAQVEQVVILHPGLGRGVPAVGFACLDMRPVGEGRLLRKAPPPRIDGVAEDAGALADARLVIDRRR